MQYFRINRWDSKARSSSKWSVRLFSEPPLSSVGARVLSNLPTSAGGFGFTGVFGQGLPADQIVGHEFASPFKFRGKL